MGIPLEKAKEKEMIFIDSNVFIASWNTDHPLYAKAKKISSRLLSEKQELITTNIVIAEVLTILSMRVHKELAIKFGKNFENLGIHLIFINDSYQKIAWEIFQKIKDKNVSFFDCTSFAVMESLGLKKVFSFDVDFAKYGFEVVE